MIKVHVPLLVTMKGYRKKKGQVERKAREIKRKNNTLGLSISALFYPSPFLIPLTLIYQVHTVKGQQASAHSIISFVFNQIHLWLICPIECVVRVHASAGVSA